MWFQKNFEDIVEETAKVAKKLPKIRVRRFAAAASDEFLSSFLGTNLSANEELRTQLRKLRERSRELSNDNPHVHKYLQLLQANLIGANGIQLQAQAMRENGNPDTLDNDAIESAFKLWSRKENCSASGQLSFRDMQNLVVQSLARDGEILIQLIRDKSNPFLFSLHPLEADYMDENQHRTEKNGNQVTMGIERNALGKPVAYHLFTEHPGENTYRVGSNQYVRVPASEIIHLFVSERPGQIRGIPFTVRSMRSLKMLAGYSEAELVAARVAASKGGFFISQTGEEYVGDAENDDGSIITNLEPGTFEELPAGVTFQPYDPNHPVSAYEAFTKAILREIAAGLGISYASLTTDLTDVNYSSIRQGALEEREFYKSLQGFLIEHFCDPVFRAWLPSAITSGQLQLPMSKLTKFQNVRWQPKGFTWIDPTKDMAANKEGVLLGVQTRSDIAAQQGKDLEDVFRQLQREQRLAEKYNIKLEMNDGNSQNTDGNFNETV